MFRPLILPALTLLASACATASAPSSQPASLPAGHPDTSKPSDLDLEAPGPLAANWLKSYEVLDGDTGETVDEASLLDRLKTSRAVYVGEAHPKPQHHAVQLAIIDKLRQLGPVEIGLEMVQRPFQPALDRYLASGDEAELLTGAEWKERWGYDFRLYRPIFLYAVTHQIPLRALNARKELTRSVARNGVEALEPELRRDLPELELGLTRHRARLRLVWAQHAGDHGMAFENFYAAQVVWDESMAESVAQTLKGHDAPERMVVLAGTGHIRYGEGIPSRAKRRGVQGSLTILPMEAQEASLLIGSGAADLIWVLTGAK